MVRSTIFEFSNFHFSLTGVWATRIGGLVVVGGQVGGRRCANMSISRHVFTKSRNLLLQGWWWSSFANIMMIQLESYSPRDRGNMGTNRLLPCLLLFRFVSHLTTRVLKSSLAPQLCCPPPPTVRSWTVTVYLCGFRTFVYHRCIVGSNRNAVW